jgi:hypothetical protein
MLIGEERGSGSEEGRNTKKMTSTIVIEKSSLDAASLNKNTSPLSCSF